MSANVFDSLWVEKYRPQKLSDVIISPENVAFFENIRAKGDHGHLLFHGPAGTGKSTLARIVATELTDAEYLYINASDEAGVDTIRNKVIDFAMTSSFNGRLKTVILDEADGLSSAVSGTAGRTSAQQALRNVMEKYADGCRFILTCNYVEKIIDPIKSRCQIIQLTLPVQLVVKRVLEILANEKVAISADQKPLLTEIIRSSYPDVRATINRIQRSVIGNVLQITQESSAEEFASTLFTRIRSKEKPETIRKVWIDNTMAFNSDYRIVLRQLFNIIVTADMAEDKKRQALLILGESLYKNGQVMDQEINFFCAVIQLQQLM